VLDEWVLSWDKVSRLLSDNGSNVIKAFNEATETIRIAAKECSQDSMDENSNIK
jgi:hypothetical protein